MVKFLEKSSCGIVVAMEFQPDLFEENDAISLLIRKMDQLQEEHSNVRRGMFARHDALKKTIDSQQKEIDALKKKLSVTLF
jgi:hypothetical protein